MMSKMTENREQPCKQCLVIQTEKERLIERVEDLESRCHREGSDLQDTIVNLKHEKENLAKQLAETEDMLQAA